MRSIAKSTPAPSLHLPALAIPIVDNPKNLLFLLLVVGIGAILVAELEASYQATPSIALSGWD